MRLLTAPGVAGIAVVRAESDERERALACLRSLAGAPLQLRAGAPPVRCVLRLEGQVVDDVLALARRDGAVEVHLHGSPVLLDHLDRCLGLSLEAPASPAERLLGEALSVEQLDLAVEQLWQPFDVGLAAVLSAPPDERRRLLQAARQRSRVALALARPRRLVLAGRQNAGKSSLFNRLLFRERALIGDLPGLTRDPIAEVTVLDGYPYELIDTAGEGQTTSAVDAAAIASGRAAREDALLVLVVDGSVGPQAVDRGLAERSALVVSNKRDLAPAPWPADLERHLEVSTVLDDAVAIRAGIGRLLTALRKLPAAGPVGGFAALSGQQWDQLTALEGDCSAGPSPA